MKAIKEIQDFCKEHNLTIDQFNGKDKIKGSLYLNSVTSIPNDFNPTVGGYLDLCSVTSIPNGFNPTVGGSLDLNSVTSIPNDFNPIVGGSIYSNFEILKRELKQLDLSWQSGKYIKVDGLFTEVVNDKGNIKIVKKINADKEFYLVTDGSGRFAHGKTIKAAKEDLIYKIKDQNKDRFKDLKLTDVLTFEEAVECYRVITGACLFGVKDFVNCKLKDRKDIYTIKEILELTNGEYGSESFKEFLTNKVL